MSNIRFPALFCICLIFIVSCKKYDGFEKKSSGYHYKYYIQNNDNPKPEVGDFVEVNIEIRTDDKIISPMTDNSMTVDESIFKGDLYAALQDMHLGDSATFIFNGKKFYEDFLNMGKYPYGNKPVYTDIKLKKIMSKNKIAMAEESFQEQKKQIKHVEDSLIADYVAEHHYTIKKNGVYLIFNKKGNGEQPKKGDKVQILYRGYFLDGKEFDNMQDPKSPCTFEIGKYQVAHGIELVAEKIHVGDEVTCILPSRLAFGETGSEFYNIPPNTPLIYRFELLKIVD